ncbi:MAG: glycerate dehydrogenase [Clostridiales bacterium]|jgi:phosphoglycerate dehydrogenase-like enzyme|nr:glycerate dehydrogenase [Clostridiales bacterium]
MKIMSTVDRECFKIARIDPSIVDEIAFSGFKSDQFFLDLVGADCLYTQSMNEISKDIINAGPRLKLIQTLGVGYEKVDLDFARSRGVFVCNSKACNSDAVAEFTLGLILAGLRRIPYYERRVYKGEFHESWKGIFTAGLRQLSGRRVGIIGFGDIAKALITLLRPFGCEIYYYNRTRGSEETEANIGITYLPLTELIKQCNVISLHVPAKPETINLIDKKEFSVMRPDTLLINAARGEVVNSQALADALIGGQIFGAALDTIYPEPPGDDHPLLNLPTHAKDRLIISPHIGGGTAEAISNTVTSFLNNVKRVDNGLQPLNVVNN